MNITLQEVIKFCEDERIKYNHVLNSRYDGNKKLYNTLLNKWETGGVDGGSCWDSSNPRPYHNNEPKPEFSDFDKVMEKFYPSISYLNHKKLMEEYLKTDKYTVYEYYGNRTDYAYESIDLGKAIAFLNKIGK